MSVPDREPSDPSEPAVAPARTDPLVRGFLFADLRGYTAFVERAGDAAAARLLARYRTMVRQVVLAHRGAEIRTEGDSFFVVFPSPSAAVRAGLALVDEATADVGTHPDDSIRVGVGVHAGESEETAEGYVGLAVNLAARICSVAGANEVLVSETVRGLTRSSLSVRFTSRGHPALKGVGEPVELYRVDLATAADDARVSAPVGGRRLGAATEGRGRIAAAVGIVGVLVVLGLAAVALGGVGRPNDPPREGAAATGAGATGPAESGASAPPGSLAAISPTTTPGTQDLRAGALPAGTYRTGLFRPGIALTVPDGWDGLVELPNFLAIGPSGDPARESGDDEPFAVGSRIEIIRPSIAYAACTPLDYTIPSYPPSATKLLGSTRDDLLAWLAADEAISMTAPKAVQIGAADAVLFDIKPSGKCPNTSRTQALFAIQSSTADVASAGHRDDFGIRATETLRVLLTTIGGQPILVAIAPGGQEMEAFSRQAMSILSSLAPTP